MTINWESIILILTCHRQRQISVNYLKVIEIHFLSIFKTNLKTFLDSHQRNNTVAVGNYESNLATILDDSEFMKKLESRGWSVDSAQPVRNSN